MDHSSHKKLVSFIWSIADDCLRDVYVRGKYRDVILPMVVLRRLDSLLEPTKDEVLDEVRFQLEDLGETELDEAPLMKKSGYVFYNISKWTLKRIHQTATNNRQIFVANVEEYLNGFSDNVKEIIECFDLKNQINKMANNDVLLDVLEKFVSPLINLTPHEEFDPEGNKLPALSNLGMGYVFEELIRKFNEDNNEEAGEHFTPREVIELMTHLVFDPIKDSLPSTISIYDPACGSGGMLTESQNFIQEKYPLEDTERSIWLFGKEVSPETYAICKSDMMIKANDPKNIRHGSTLSTDEFSSEKFDFMLSNPPYGKSWGTEQKYIKEDGNVIDSRFLIKLNDYWGETSTVDAIPRSSDGQLLFLMEMVDKMKSAENGALGSRIASVHNGSSLFTGDAGSGESNIRRYIIENDKLDAIVQLPNNLFYNTGITTYIWLLNNNKPADRANKVQLIDASFLFKKLRKNLGDKNCEFTPEHITEITQTYLDTASIKRQKDENGDPVGIASQVFDNEDFGYYKVNIERPDRRKAQFRTELIAPLRFDKTLREVMEYAFTEFGEKVYQEHFFKSDNKAAEKAVLAWCEENEVSLNAKAKTKLFDTKTWVKQRNILQMTEEIAKDIGSDEYDDFNVFRSEVDTAIKGINELQKSSDKEVVKLSATEKKSILDSVSWYDADAVKVIKKKVKFTEDKLNTLLEHLACEESDLADFGYYAIEGKTREYITFESNTDLRDAESVPLKYNESHQQIHQYYLDEVKPYVSESWINLDSTKIGYEVNFNKFFYQHRPLRTMDEVAQDIINLEKKTEGLIADILGINVGQLHGV
ncbi:type I restriction-modification system subunit M [Pseudoalteromonas carrageenovora]|uniref:type I restriction-modification system subunit M n=1 Tax=Pseudoalteromonas carrageenovora TaxID=227 RepID=UPI0026E448B7|nr:class I SAM-dependent DNA methyltransferase [Pseudoalteromonas carrageenovora]MDO6547331.1 class I SAM-dependent DNA methyltransferase [Pseudoalteromonas carrageenovora]MDO6831779.1 class I SAM-dependent DNA methyltransferase [Pseudoalteromonas carrageenovora]